MAGESQLPPESHPDPSTATMDAITRSASAMRDYVNGQIAVLVQRLNDIDRATELLNETVNRVPTEVQKEVGHLKELMNERQVTFNSSLDAVRESAAKQDEAYKIGIASVAEANADVKERVVRMESSRLGGIEERTEQRTVTAGVYAAIGVAVALLLAAITIGTLVLAG